MGLEVSFPGDFSVLESQFFCRRVSESRICRFFFNPFGLQESNFSELMSTAY